MNSCTSVIKYRISKTAKLSVNYLFISLLAFIILFPFFIMVLTSFMLEAETLQLPRIFFPKAINVGTYMTLFKRNSNFLVQTKNSLMICGLNIVGIPFFSSLCAYGFAKMKFKGREAAFAIVMSTLMIPGAVTMVPLYVIYQKLNWINTTLPLWLPGWFGGGAINIFLIRQFMKGIPNDMLNAARIDGANSLRIYFYIMMPLCMPIILFIAVQCFMGSWDNFMAPLMYINEPSMYTLALGLYLDYCVDGITPANTPNYSMAAGMMMLLPCALLFFIFQKQLIAGVSITGLK